MCHEESRPGMAIHELVSLSLKPDACALFAWLRNGSGLVILSREPAKGGFGRRSLNRKARRRRGE